MLTPLFASCDAAAHTHATVTASASAPSNRMVAHRRVALCRSSRRRTRARTRLAWTTRGETRRLPRSVDLRNERCPVFHVTPTRGDSRPPPSLLTPLLLPLPSAPSLSPIHPPPPPTRRNTPRAEGASARPRRAFPRGDSRGETPVPGLSSGRTRPFPPPPPRTPSRPPCRSWDPSGRARDPTAPFPLHVRTSRGTDRTCAWIDPRFPRRTFGGPRAARVAPGSGYRRNRMRGRTTARARGAGRSPVRNPPSASMPRSMARARPSRTHPSTSANRLLDASLHADLGPAAWTAAISSSAAARNGSGRPSSTYIAPTPLGTSASTLAGTGSRVVRGARSRDEREVEREGGVLPAPQSVPDVSSA